MEKGKRHVSLKDLAKEIGVSISTVSRALNNHPDISPEVTMKIQKLAAEMNYSPNPLAMGLLKQATRMIGVIVPDLVTHFYSSIISGIEQIAEEKGYYILIASSNETLQKEIKAIENLMKTRVEGLIVCLSQETQSYRVINEDSGSNTDFEQNVRPYDVGLSFGMGFVNFFKPGPGRYRGRKKLVPVIQVDFRYNIGLMKIGLDNSVPNMEVRNHTFTLGVSITSIRNK